MAEHEHQWSELPEYVYCEVCDMGQADYLREQTHHIAALEAENARLRADLATLANASARDMTVLVHASADLKALEGLARAVAAADFPWDKCEWCLASDRLTEVSGESEHAPDCPVTQARALLSKDTPHQEA